MSNTQLFDKILQEIGGLTSNTGAPGQINKLSNILQPGGNQPYSTDQPGYTKNPGDVSLCSNEMFGFSPGPWQQAICHHVLNLHDIFINVPPAAGKTKPVICGWQSRCIQMAKTNPDIFRDPRQIPKLVWITPTTQLATQIFYDDLTSSVLDVYKLSSSIFFNKVTGSHIDPDDYNSLSNWLYNDAISLRCGTGRKGPDDPSVAAVCTYEFAPKIINKIKPTYLIVDEFQEYVPQRTGQSQSETYQSVKDKIIKLYDSIVSLKNQGARDTSLILLTGTVNDNAARQIKDFFKQAFNVDFQYIKPIQNVQNRASVHIHTSSQLNNANDIINLSKNIIQKKIPQNAIVLFSVGDLPPESQRQITRVGKSIRPIAQKLVNEIPARSIDNVLYSRHNYQNKDATIRNIENIEKYTSSPAFMREKLEKMINDEENGEDKLLGQCLLRGFGYVIGGQALTKRISSFDAQKFAESVYLVQNLFAMRKIYLIFCTNAIGVGANFKIKNLFLPSLQKWSGFGHAPLDDSTLVQLVNRVGRKGDITASIYCHPSDFGRISGAMFQDPRSWVSPDILNLDQPKEELKSIAGSRAKDAKETTINGLTKIHSLLKTL